MITGMKNVNKKKKKKISSQKVIARPKGSYGPVNKN